MRLSWNSLLKQRRKFLSNCSINANQVSIHMDIFQNNLLSGCGSEWYGRFYHQTGLRCSLTLNFNNLYDLRQNSRLKTLGYPRTMPAWIFTNSQPDILRVYIKQRGTCLRGLWEKNTVLQICTPSCIHINRKSSRVGYSTDIPRETHSKIYSVYHSTL